MHPPWGREITSTFTLTPQPRESITKVLKESSEPYKDRATRSGFFYLETLLALQGQRIEVVNLADNGKEDLITDLVSIVYSFATRFYGQRRAKHRTDC